MVSVPDRVTTLQEDAIAAAEALRRSEAGVVEVLRALQRRRDEEADAETLFRVEQQLRALIEVAAAVAAVHSLDDVLELAAEHALSATGAASLSISRWEPETQLIYTLINVGELAPEEERRPANEVYHASEFPLWNKLFDGVPQINAVNDPDSDPGQRDLLRQLGKESSIGVAIRFRGEVWGELWATTSPGAPQFNRDDVIFLQTIAEQIGSAIGRAELFDRIAALAYRDPLTDLSNRRALDDAIHRALAVPDREVTVLMCDLDGLKAANDELGHAAGDEMLLHAAHALRNAAAIHPDAVVARVGGDEFCVLLPTGGTAAAREIALEASRRLQFEDPPVTMSCGAAATQGGAPTDLLRAADAAQYEAKHRGCGFFCLAEASSAVSLPGTDGRRRSFRDRGARAVGSLVQNTLALLDGELAGAPVEDRLRAVAGGFATLLDAKAWGIGFALRGSGSLATLYSSDGRDLALTSGALELTTGFVIHAGDPSASPYDRQLLRSRGHAGVIGVATVALDRTYVIALFTGDRGLQLRSVVPELRLLALAAVAG